MSKAKEFYVHEKGVEINGAVISQAVKLKQGDTITGEELIHTIEISALNKLNKQLELTKAFLEAALGDCKDAEVAEEMAGNYKKAMGEVEDED